MGIEDGKIRSRVLRKMLADGADLGRTSEYFHSEDIQ